MLIGFNRYWITQRRSLRQRSFTFKLCEKTFGTIHVRRVEGPGHHADDTIRRTRNIGIIAHIDAVFNSLLLTTARFNIWQGKTTTTERMLYYSGFIPRMGSMLYRSSLVLITCNLNEGVPGSLFEFPNLYLLEVGSRSDQRLSNILSRC